MIQLMWIALIPHFPQQIAQPKEQRATITYGDDREIRVQIQGRSGNLELRHSRDSNGEAVVDFQNGSGYVSYDRGEQVLEWVAHRRFSMNHLSKNVVRKAPYMKLKLPLDCELDFNLDLTDLGYGTLKFDELNVKRFHFDVNYGDVDISFPTVNKSIIRDQVTIHLMVGDLEIYDLGNLKASDIVINSGIGELSIDLGPAILTDTTLSLDHDIGTIDITIPKGTYAVIKGTSRSLDKYGFVKNGKIWVTKEHQSEFPMLTIDLQGPVGGLDLHWSAPSKSAN